MRRVNASQIFEVYFILLAKMSKRRLKESFGSFLIEKTESHVVVRLFFGFFLLFLFLLPGSSTTSGGSTCGSWSSGTTTGWDGSKLLATFGNELLDALALQLGDDLVELLAVSINTD